MMKTRTYQLYFVCMCAVLFINCIPGVFNLPTKDMDTKELKPVLSTGETDIATQERNTSSSEDNGGGKDVDDDDGNNAVDYDDEQDSPQAPPNKTQKQRSADRISATNLRKVISLKVTPVLCALGILGNIINLIVLTNKKMKGSTNYFLMALAISDMMLLVMQIGPIIVNTENIVGYSHTYILASRYLHIMRYTMSNLFITCTSWLTVAVTIERFIAIRFALKAKIMCTVHRAKVAIITIFIISFLFHFSKWFEYGVNKNTEDQNPVKLIMLSLSKTYMSLMHSVNIAIAVFIPEISLSILNTLLVFFLIKHQSSTKHMKKQTSQEIVHITTVVIVMVLVFMMCHSIGLYLAINISLFDRSTVLGTPTGIRLRAINNFLVLLNSSVNFILYTAISQRFRDTLKSIILGCTKSVYKLPKGKNSNYGSSSSSSRTKSTSSYSKKSTKESAI